MQSRDRIVDALMGLMGERPWGEATLEAIAERAGVSLADLRADFEGRGDMLRAFTQRVDESVLQGRDPGMAGEGARDRLFDILFSRVEALNPYKAAIRNLAAAAHRDPLLALELNGIVTRSMGWMLAGARIDASGGMGALRAQGLALVWRRVLQVWLDDDDPTLQRTMAELDRQLRRSERIASRIESFCRAVGPRRAQPPAPTPPPTPPADVVEAHPS